MKVTQIAHYHDLNPGKYNMLVEQARDELNSVTKL